jgi:16S rRNA (guanine966-N2)-methyltransferase
MRVTGGSAKGVRLRSPQSSRVRPTMDRVRSALFSILAPLGMEGAVVADLFAGTGSLGIEALSRAAAHADFVESDTRQCSDIRANLEAARLQNQATVHRMSVERAMKALQRSYHFVLMDPPYSQPFPINIVELLLAQDLLQPEAVVVVGHATRVPSPERCGGLIRSQDRRYGDSSLAFYTQQGVGVMA